MKVFLLFVLSLLTFHTVKAQVSDTIEVGFTKSAFLLFDTKDLKFECGSEEVVVRHSENKIIVQAEISDFEETNLFVQSDNQIFLFIVRYVDSPKRFLYDFTSTSKSSHDPQKNIVSSVYNSLGNVTGSKGGESLDSSSSEVGLSKSNMSVIELRDVDQERLKAKQALYRGQANTILSAPQRITNRGIIQYKINIYLTDIAIKDDTYYLKFEAANSSNIPYTFDFLRYWVRPVKRRIKGESYQEIELTSLLEHERPHVLSGKSRYEFVIVMDKFVLIKDKKLVIEYWESNGQDLDLEGGRKIEFDVFYSDILNIRVL